ncbi:hypothetical protein V1522DRAFT_438671 [Lipomyces starkeyi]
MVFSQDDLQFLDGAVRKFVYKNLYSDLTVCTSNLHGILHPICGYIVTMLQGKKRKDESLSNAILINEQVLLPGNPDAYLSFFLQEQENSQLTGLLDQCPANWEDVVSPILATVSCQNDKKERSWDDHQFAVIKVFQDVEYAGDQNVLYGRLVRINLTDIECTVAINRFTQHEYTRNRNWVTVTPYRISDCSEATRYTL